MDRLLRTIDAYITRSGGERAEPGRSARAIHGAARPGPA